ncbi:macrolide ABC transporter permease/ATP-binding protein MacB [Vibrio splendidus]|uniref:Pyoverdine export ATP-binding/permease protein PvdT n=1 Tax=Vibrio splendidus TaxID=29497 RepID=A0A2T5EQX8_VIBSP|nr:MacB family efflux pump subunit [Vibrio splendidus]PMJ63069.1 macrolide ABC transporter permease/ATP-binding protein MacB [Vibrio splendidus]PTP26942.1 macrolide ABC transporter permease/ATP-binding protein MacB [Vibrio splendidus]
MNNPLLEIKGVSRAFQSGDQALTVLNNIDLAINRGEMVAIIGASGSGKSTLMNILGCLDKPSQGQYLIDGQDVSNMDADQLAQLRRENFGFIFQRYHLLSDLTALENAEIPALYANTTKEQRREKAEQLLTRLGLEERLDHKPNQLSGGQQQRVSVARALVNGGDVILADEPTGALDSHSGKEMMQLIQELHADGHTIILVTHDPKVAAFADRVIEIKDGQIIQDQQNHDKPKSNVVAKENNAIQDHNKQLSIFRYLEAFKMALLAMSNNRLRTFLTMLGIIIGIASVVSVVAMGTGSQQTILENMANMGTNTIEIKPGTGRGDKHSGRIRTLTADDAKVLENFAFVDSVTPTVRANGAIRYASEAHTGSVEGVGLDYFRVKGLELDKGQFFSQESIDSLEQVAIIDANVVTDVFQGEDPIGKVIFLGQLPVRVIGVTAEQDDSLTSSDTLNVWLPYSTVSGRLLNQSYVNDITVRLNDEVSSSAAEQAIITLIKARHGAEDFFTVNTDAIRQNIEKTSSTMTMLISAIAFISLVVGGIGVMNIMLVSVTERTREIGIRMAVGARQTDILRQFLIEAVLVCVLGGLMGIGLAYFVGFALGYMGSDIRMIYSTSSIIAAFSCSTLIGVVFGFLPASNAAKLDPVEALARD